MNIRGFYIYISILNNYFEEFKINNELFKNINKINNTNNNFNHSSSINFINGIKMCNILNTKYCLLCEEDIAVNNNSILNNFIYDFNNIENSSTWDIIILTPFGYNSIYKNTELQKHNFYRVYNNTLTSAIIIKKHMLAILLNIFEEIYNSTNNIIDKKYYTIFNYNNYWSNLQNKYNFYTYNKIFLSQLMYNYRINNNISNIILNTTIITSNNINVSKKIVKYNSNKSKKDDYKLKTSKKILFIIIIGISGCIISCIFLLMMCISIIRIYLKIKNIFGYNNTKIYPFGSFKYNKKGIRIKKRSKNISIKPVKISVMPK